MGATHERCVDYARIRGRWEARFWRVQQSLNGWPSANGSPGNGGFRKQMKSPDKNSPVFIIGGSRTGSEMLKTMLSVSPDLDFVDELFLRCPRWLHKDLERNILQNVGGLDADCDLERLLDFLFSGSAYGWFWSVIDEQLDRDMLRKELERGALDLRSIFAAMMTVHATMRDKSRVGAKFPLHYSFTPLLIKWFPECRIIHTTREPKAVYASQVSKYIRDDSIALDKSWMRFRQFVHINLQVSWTARIHRRYRELPNYRLVRYEDVVRNPEREMRKLCDFLGTEFDDAMLSPNQYGSSFGDIGGRKGVDASSLEKWRDAIGPITATAMDVCHVRARNLFGY